MELEQQLQRLDLDIAEHFARSIDELDPLMSELAALIEQRAAVIDQLLLQPQGQDRQWLQQRLNDTARLTQQAQNHQQDVKQQIGQFRKGRGQVQRYQQVEAGQG